MSIDERLMELMEERSLSIRIYDLADQLAGVEGQRVIILDDNEIGEAFPLVMPFRYPDDPSRTEILGWMLSVWEDSGQHSPTKGQREVLESALFGDYAEELRSIFERPDDEDRPNGAKL